MIDNNKNNLKLKPESTKSEEKIAAEEPLENFEDYELLAERYSKDGYVVFVITLMLVIGNAPIVKT